MRSIVSIIVAACVFAYSCAEAKALSITPTALTPKEQSRLIVDRGTPAERGSSHAASAHVSRAKTLLERMDSLVNDGTRKGNPLFRQTVYHLEKARVGGIDYNSAIRRIYADNWLTPPARILQRKQALRTAMKASNELGLLTPENMDLLRSGKAPHVTKGNPRFIGESVHVDHRVPIRGANGRPIYENELANLRMLSRIENLRKGANVDDIQQQYAEALDRTTWKNDNITMYSGALNTAAGVTLLYTSSYGLYNAWVSGDASRGTRIAENSALLLAGGGFTAAGAAQIGMRFAQSESAIARLAGIAKWGGCVGIVGTGLGEGIGVFGDWQRWDTMTARQQSVSMLQHGISIAGLLTSFVTAVVITSETGPASIAFGLAAAGATYAASRGATILIEASYDRLDEQQKQEFTNFIYNYYGVRS